VPVKGIHAGFRSVALIHPTLRCASVARRFAKAWPRKISNDIPKPESPSEKLPWAQSRWRVCSLF
jgi:hypothetical protein